MILRGGSYSLRATLTRNNSSHPPTRGAPLESKMLGCFSQWFVNENGLSGEASNFPKLVPSTSGRLAEVVYFVVRLRRAGIIFYLFAELIHF